MIGKNVLIVLGVLGVCSMARADIKYTTEMTLSGGLEDAPKTTTMRAVKPNFERTESTQQVGPLVTKNVTIRECGKRQTIQLDPELKIYTVIPDYEDEPVTGDGAGDTPKADKPATGKIVMTYSIQDLDEETILNFKTQHYMVNTTIESSGCAGEGTHSTLMEIWVSDVRDAHPCPDENSATVMAKSMSHGDCKVQVELKGDSDKFLNINKGLILRQKMYNGNMPLMTTEVTSLSQAKLGDELFTVPADFKKVSAEEFQKAKTEAMVKAMQAGITIEPDDEK